MSEHQNTYAAFKEKQSELAELLEDASETIAVLNLTKDKNYLKSLSEKVNSDSFKLLVVGEFKNGKSTFINSFLGQEVLPAYSVPCTAVISEIKYGPEPKAFLYFIDSMSKEAKNYIAESNAKMEVKEHIRRYDGEAIPPIEIPASEIEDYATIPTDKSEKEMARESPYKHIELFWPLELLESGVELIDSPGLNEAETRTLVTMNYLEKADAILFVISATKLGGNAETNFIDLYLKRHGFNEIYFIINRWDQVRNEKEKQRTMDFAKKKLSEFTSFGESGLYFVSALNALDGKTQNKPALYDGSGMPEFEGELSYFLVNHRGRVKLSQPAKELRRVLETEVLKKAIPQLRGMLESSLAQMIARRDEAKPRLEKLKARQASTRKNISAQIDQAIPEIRYHINKFLADLNSNIAVWVNEFEPTTSVGMIPNKGKIESIINEISDYIKGRVEEEQMDWQNNTLGPFIVDKATYILTSNEGNLENFFLELGAIRVTISGVGIPGESDVPLLQRLLAAGAGFIATGFSGAALGGMEGFSRDFVKGIMVQVAAMFGLSLLGLLNPLTIILLIGASLFTSFSSNGSKIVGKIKEKVIEAIQTQVINSGVDSIETMLDGLKNKLWERFDPILKGMDAEVLEVENQLNRIIEEMKQGQEEVDRQKSILASCEEKVHRLKSKADEFITLNIEGR